MTHTCPTGATPNEAKDFLADNTDIEAIDIVLHDSNGIGRGKIIRRHELLSLYESGRHLPISILGLDICGEDVDETRLIWDRGDGDLRAWPLPGTLTRLHNTSPPRAEVLLSLYELDGAPMTSDPRHAMQRQVDAFAEHGLYPAGAFELEFFLLAKERAADGSILPATNGVNGLSIQKTDVYSVDCLYGMMPFFSDIYAAAKLADINVETMISEYAPGQYELTLHYRVNVVQAADDLMRLKRIVRAQAQAHNMIACFMAKPMSNYAGSGMHFHVSLANETGSNALAEADGEQWSRTLLNALGGLQATMGESMLVFAPHLNSWRRFVDQSYAPVSTNWGSNNRSVALRIPAGDIRARRLEHRTSGVDANPYLVGTTVLAGMMHGLDKNLDPGPETKGNGYRDASVDSTMPRDWLSAIEAAQSSSFLKHALGEDMHRTFTAVKTSEYVRAQSIVSEVDYALYLHAV